MRLRTILGGLVLTMLLPAAPASATPPGSQAAATVALQWNAYAVTAVRSATTTNQLPPNTTSRSLYQTEGLLYMSYVQAAVYDAATKIGHRYVPYHHFSAGAGNASIEAAVIAAAYNTLVYYLGDPAGVLAQHMQTPSPRFPTTRTLPGELPSARRRPRTSRHCGRTTDATRRRPRRTWAHRPILSRRACGCGRQRRRCRSTKHRGWRSCSPSCSKTPRSSGRRRRMR